MTILFYILLFLFLLLCVVLAFVILIQEAKSLGLGASFGGDSGDSLFGTSTAEVLKRFTASLAGVFLVGCLMLSLWSGAMGRKAASPTSAVPISAPVEEESEGTFE
jgi:preprotein translocase subunit SecG